MSGLWFYHLFPEFRYIHLGFYPRWLFLHFFALCFAHWLYFEAELVLFFQHFGHYVQQLLAQRIVAN